MMADLGFEVDGDEDFFDDDFDQEGPEVDQQENDNVASTKQIESKALSVEAEPEKFTAAKKMMQMM